MTGDPDPPGGYGKPPKSKRFPKGRRPHNKRVAPSDSLKEAAARSFSSLRTVMVRGEPKTMSVRESLVREDVEKALNGNISAIIRIVTMMMQHPELIENRTEWRLVIRGAATRL